MDSRIATWLVLFALLGTACLGSLDAHQSGGSQCEQLANQFGVGYAQDLQQLCQGCLQQHGPEAPCEQCLVQAFNANELGLAQRAAIAEQCLATSEDPYWFAQAAAVQQCIQDATPYDDSAVSAFIACLFCVLDEDTESKSDCHQCLVTAGQDFDKASTCLHQLNAGVDDGSKTGNDTGNDNGSAPLSPAYWYELLDGGNGGGLAQVDVTPILPDSNSGKRCSEVIAKYFAVGTVNYTCTDSLNVHSIGAVAKLYTVPDGDYAGHHYWDADGPVFEIANGKAHSVVVAGVASSNPASGPDELLQVTSAYGSLDYAVLINRVFTAGGKAPSSCKAAGKAAYVPYIAYYIFYAARADGPCWSMQGV